MINRLFGPQTVARLYNSSTPDLSNAQRYKLITWRNRSGPHISVASAKHR